MSRVYALLAAATLVATPAAAEVQQAAADGFTSVHSGHAPRPPAEVWAALVDWGGWWPTAHTYSGDAANLDLDLEPDGELEEEWDGGFVLHGSVLQAMPPKFLRLSAAFGPLQMLPVNGILDIELKPSGAGTDITMTYRVGGPASAGLEAYAGPVDTVIGEGFTRLLAARPLTRKDK